jgi:uncharacterized membrane protein
MILLRAMLWSAWPIMVLYAFDVWDPRTIAILLVVVHVARHHALLKSFAGSVSRLECGAFACALMLCIAVVVANDEMLLRLYPVAVNAGMLLVFGASLVHPPSIIERIALIREPELSTEGKRYTRAVTQAWCFFFLVNGAIASWTALAGSRELWALYNGLIAYLLMGALFGAELLCRRYWRTRQA